VLELDPTNVKALFRRAQALMSMNDFELAETDLNKASELAPNDADVRKQMVMLKELEKQHAQKQKQYALNLQKMFK
jgi:FK506-binding protein 4/5